MVGIFEMEWTVSLGTSKRAPKGLSIIDARFTLEWVPGSFAKVVYRQLRACLGIVRDPVHV